MKILVTATHVPFISGGAEYHMQGLVKALQTQGHQVELLRVPFKFHPEQAIQDTLQYIQTLDLTQPNGIQIDQIISLQFPTYGIQHPNHRIWVMHQHRAVYDLYQPEQATPELKNLKQRITEFDNKALTQAKKCFANSKNVAQRLKQFNQIQATPLYHPPPQAESFFHQADLGYIYCPSRLEKLKRQDLLIEAVAQLKHTRLKFLISGTGGQQAYYQGLIEQYQLQDKVALLGHVSEAEKRTLYANATAIFFAPYDEDYGYITLEAMLSAKPVITCHDSGGVLEFIQHQHNGWICSPSPQAIADTIAEIEQRPSRATEMGQQGKNDYQAYNINWQAVTEQLTAP